MTDFSGIKAFVFDIDGVATDGGILAMPDGDLLRIFNAKDSFAIRMAVMNGYHIGVITGGASESIRSRFSVCGVDGGDIYLHSRNKLKDLNEFCRVHSLELSEVMYFGDDIPDICALQASGIGVCPSDACEEVKAVADIISPYPGGKCCLRYSIKKVMSAQGRWIFDDGVYAVKF